MHTLLIMMGEDEGKNTYSESRHVIMCAWNVISAFSENIHTYVIGRCEVT